MSEVENCASCTSLLFPFAITLLGCIIIFEGLKKLISNMRRKWKLLEEEENEKK